MRNVIELYHRGMSAEALAQAVIAEYFDGKEPSFPIKIVIVVFVRLAERRTV